MLTFCLKVQIIHQKKQEKENKGHFKVPRKIFPLMGTKVSLKSKAQMKEFGTAQEPINYLNPDHTILHEGRRG